MREYQSISSKISAMLHKFKVETYMGAVETYMGSVISLTRILHGRIHLGIPN